MPPGLRTLRFQVLAIAFLSFTTVEGQNKFWRRWRTRRLLSEGQTCSETGPACDPSQGLECTCPIPEGRRLFGAPAASACLCLSQPPPPPPPPLCSLGMEVTSPGDSCQALRTTCPELPTGNYYITLSGTPSQAHCVMSGSDGWLAVVASNNTFDRCSSWLSCTGGCTFSCDATRAHGVLSSDNANLEIWINMPSEFSHLQFVGRVWSSGGGGSPCFDWPDSADRQGKYACHEPTSSTCVDPALGDASTYGYIARSEDLTSAAGGSSSASWYVWSDSGNICGNGGNTANPGWGGYWDLSEILVK